MKTLTSKIGKKMANSKAGKWTGRTAKQVFSQKNMKEFGRPILLGTTLFLGLEKLGVLDLEATDYFYTNWATKLACYGTMNFQDVKEKKYGQIANDIIQDAKDLTKYTQSEIQQGIKNTRKYVKEGLDDFAKD